MKTFAINLPFITGTIERFVVTLHVSLRKHVVSIFSAVSAAAKRKKKERKRSMSIFYG